MPEQEKGKEEDSVRKPEQIFMMGCTKAKPWIEIQELVSINERGVMSLGGGSSTKTVV